MTSAQEVQLRRLEAKVEKLLRDRERLVLLLKTLLDRVRALGG